MSADGTPPPALVYLRLTDLLESPWQPPGRSERALDELTASISMHGILEPLIVRPIPTGHEIVAGHRRRRAGVKAGLELGPCLVRELSDEEAREIALVENAQRLDLSPLEEAIAFGRLRDEHGYTAERIAERVGKGRATIYRRLTLLRLANVAKEALEQGRVAVGVAEELAMLHDETAQGSALEAILKYDDCSALAAKRIVRERFHLRLASAGFDLADASLVSAAGPCTTCSKRSSAQLLLIGEGAPEEERCTDATCFEGKRAAHWVREKAEAEKSGLRAIEGEEARKLYPYGALDHKRPDLVDLDARCSYGQPDFGAEDVEPRTWSDVLGERAQPTAVVLAPDGKVHRLAERKSVVRALREAGMDEEAKRKEANAKALDKPEGPAPWELENRAFEQATEAGLGTIVGLAERKKVIDEKAMRHLSAVLAHVLCDDQLIEMAEMRELIDKAKSKPGEAARDERARKALLVTVKGAPLGHLYGLALEMAIRADPNYPPSKGFAGDTAFIVAARQADFDFDEAKKEALRTIKAEVRSKAKAKEQKASKAKEAAATTEPGVSPETPAVSREPMVSPLSVACPRCKSAAGVACNKRLGGHHAERVKAAKERAADTTSAGGICSHPVEKGEPKATPWLRSGDRIRVIAGDLKGRVGKIDQAHLEGDLVAVLLDRLPGPGRPRKGTDLVPRGHVEREG